MPITITLTDQVRQTLKRMWFLDSIVSKGNQLGREDTKFYNENLKTIRYYYEANSRYWDNREKLNSII